MSHHRIPLRQMWAPPARLILRSILARGATLLLLLTTACGGGGPSGPGGGGGDATLSGTIRAAGSSTALANATVSAGARTATSDANGRFELTDLPTGAATVHVERPGYLTAEAVVTIAAGANSHDFSLSVQEIYRISAIAVYVPPGNGPIRGTIVTLGGPNTSGFVTGEPITNGSIPELELGLQALGASLRALARSKRMALLGSATIAMANNSTSDAIIFAALGTAAEESDHPEITSAPVLMFGLSAGGPEAAGLVSRHPERSIGLLERVPVSVSSLTTTETLAVPAFVMLAELDAVVNNAAVRATFTENRSRGGRWALAVEPQVDHSTASSKGNDAAINWIGNALDLRLPATPGQPLIELDQPSGWLGNQATLDVAPWADYLGDRTAASWLLSASQAAAWKFLATP